MRFGIAEELMSWYLTKKEIDVRPFKNKNGSKRGIDEAIMQCMGASGTGYSLERFEDEVIAAVYIDTILMKLSPEERRHVFAYVVGEHRYVPKAMANALKKFEKKYLEADGGL